MPSTAEQSQQLAEGHAHLNQGRLEQAAEAFAKAIQSHPEPAAVISLATVRLGQGRGQEAANLLLQALSHDPQHNAVHRGLDLLAGNPAARAAMADRLDALLQRDALEPGDRSAVAALSKALQATTPYKAAVTAVNITPQLESDQPVYLQGYAGPPRAAERALTPLGMRLLLLEDAHYSRALIVSADLFGFGDEMVTAVRRALRPWGIPPEAIVLNASHTHYAPGTVGNVPDVLGPVSESYARAIAGAIEQLMPTLVEQLEDCLLYSGQGDGRIGLNRRRVRDGRTELAPAPEGAYDESVPVLLAEFPSSNRRVALLSHGCHPTGLNAAGVISADYPAWLREELTGRGGLDDVLFLQGPAGTAKESAAGGEAAFASRPEHVASNGAALAQAVRRVLDGGMRPVGGELFAASRTATARFQHVPTSEQLQRVAAAPQAGALAQSWARAMLACPQQLRVEQPISVQMLALGQTVRLLTLPGEPAAELAGELRRVMGAGATDFLLGYTNGLKAYLPTAEMIDRGGYEVQAAHQVYCLPGAFTRDVEQELLAAADDLCGQFARTDDPSVFGRRHLRSGTGEAFFCLSSGRCGTMTLARALDTAENACVYHHPRPYLVAETLQAWHGRIDRAETFWRGRSGVIRQAWAEGQVFGELDMNMTPFAPEIAREVPSAKFLVLVRNPWEFVRSGMRRGYYQGHAWDAGRLRPEPDHPDAQRWASMSPFEKVCWLWAETYRRIEAFVEQIGPERCLRVSLEKLIAAPDTTREIFDFLGLQGYDPAAIEQVQSKRLNQQTGGQFPAPAEWSDSQRQTLWRECGDVAERHGYGADDLPLREASAGPAPRKTQQRVEARTIWDYRKFRHQPYPQQVQLEQFAAPRDGEPRIRRTTAIASMGSCFARNVALHLMRREFNYLVTEQPFQQASAHWDQVFNTACMRQIFEYTFTDDFQPVTRWWPRESEVQDPFRRDIIYPAETCEADFARHRQASREALGSAELVILTLGLIETWRDRRDGATFYRVPSPRVYNPDVHEFHVQTVDDCVADLTRVRELLATHNPSAQLLVTVSPVPLFATFRMDVDPISANTLSKCTLRTAAEYLAQAFENVHYFPSFEIVTQALRDPYEADNRHVTQATIARVMDVFEARYAVEG